MPVVKIVPQKSLFLVSPGSENLPKGKAHSVSIREEKIALKIAHSLSTKVWKNFPKEEIITCQAR